MNTCGGFLCHAEALKKHKTKNKKKRNEDKGAHGLNAGVHRHIQRRGSGPGVQPDERVCIPRGKRQPQRGPVRRGRPAHTQRMVQLPEVHPRTVRPTERSPRAQNPDAKSRGTGVNAVRLRHVEPARVPLRHAAPSPPQVLDSLHRLAKAQSRRPPDFLSGHACQDGK